MLSQTLEPFRKQANTNFILVPVALLNELSERIEKLQRSLKRKQCQLGKVIRRQEKKILKQNEEILQLKGATLQTFDPEESLKDLRDSPHESTGDSAMGDEDQEEEAGSAEENSDSFITISDASFTDSEVSREDADTPHEDSLNVIEDGCFQANPYFDSDQSLEPEAGPGAEITQTVVIGDPEDLVAEELESCIPDTLTPSMSCLPRPVRMFRRSVGKGGGLGGLNRWSKSEGNIKELLGKEPKSPFFGSFRNLWRKKEDSPPQTIMSISSPILNGRPMILKTGDPHHSTTYNSMTDLRSTGSPEPSSRASQFFSCLGSESSRAGPVSMSNHKTVRRPRDVKLRSHRRSQTVTVVAENYHLNYSIC